MIPTIKQIEDAIFLRVRPEERLTFFEILNHLEQRYTALGRGDWDIGYSDLRGLTLAVIRGLLEDGEFEGEINCWIDDPLTLVWRSGKAAAADLDGWLGAL